eukprot:111061_1
MLVAKMLQRRFRYKSVQTLHQASKLTCIGSPRMFSSSPIAENNEDNWWWRPSLPSETVEFNEQDHINDAKFEIYIRDQWHHNGQEKLSLCRKSNTLSSLFENVSIDLLDNVLQRSIIDQCNVEQVESNMDSWMIFNYHKHHDKHDWRLCNPEEYDANGVVIAGLSTENNKAYTIGPIILHKDFAL